ncbi:MAG: FAD-binding oxidoreductase [Magnetovibrio sp.]|nr:FAD-binding oxidoreductase [Magnetovibrio sp.]
MTEDGAWQGYRSFVVKRKEPESETITSFYLAPEDGGALPDYHPGQYLGFSLDVPERMTPVIRTYTISDSQARDGCYRLSIKREPAPADAPDAPPGVSSNFFHDHVEVGSTLQVRAPSGDFVLRPQGKGPVVLLSGGVGCTPMIAMLNAVVDAAAERDIWFVHGARSGAEHAFGAHVRAIAAAHDNIRAHICYSQPGAGDVQGEGYDSAGHVTIDLLKELLPNTGPQFFLCGSTPFMKSLYNGLVDWGVDEFQIVYEFFGTACELRDRPEPSAADKAAEMGLDPDTRFQVEFRQSGVTAEWTPAAGSILELAEANGVEPDFICRSGMCHTCLSTCLEGEFQYLHDDVVEPMGDDEVLICSARPKTDIVIDA